MKQMKKKNGNEYNNGNGEYDENYTEKDDVDAFYDPSYSPNYSTNNGQKKFLNP